MRCIVLRKKSLIIDSFSENKPVDANSLHIIKQKHNLKADVRENYQNNQDQLNQTTDLSKTI
jgi:hypothetical protein